MTISGNEFYIALSNIRTFMLSGKFRDAEYELDNLFDFNVTKSTVMMELTDFGQNPNAIMTLQQYLNYAAAGYTDLAEVFYRQYLDAMRVGNETASFTALSNAVRLNYKARDKSSAKAPDLAIRISYIDAKLAFAFHLLNEGMRHLNIIQNLVPIGQQAYNIKIAAKKELERIYSDNNNARLKGIINNTMQYTDFAANVLDISDWLVRLLKK